MLLCILHVLLLYFPYKLANHCIHVSCVCLLRIELQVLALLCFATILTTAESITRQHSHFASVSYATEKCIHKMILAKFYATGYHYFMLISISKGKNFGRILILSM